MVHFQLETGCLQDIAIRDWMPPRYCNQRLDASKILQSGTGCLQDIASGLCISHLEETDHVVVDGPVALVGVGGDGVGAGHVCLSPSVPVVDHPEAVVATVLGELREPRPLGAERRVVEERVLERGVVGQTAKVERGQVVLACRL